MRLKRVDIIKREGGNFHLPDRKVKAYRKGDGFGVMVFFEQSPIDTDFGEFVWCPTAKELDRLNKMLDQSDKKTYDLIGHGWGGERPYMRLEEVLL